MFFLPGVDGGKFKLNFSKRQDFSMYQKIWNLLQFYSQAD